VSSVGKLVFTMPILVFTMPIRVFTMADPGVHVPPIRLFTMFRSARSRWAEIRRWPSGAYGASTRGELAPPWTPQLRASRCL
jgi:hypothetical protein